MQITRKIKEDLFYVGASDRRLSLFENIYPIPNGISYNSYLLLDEKTVLLDTADASVGRQFFENVAATLSGRPLDYLIVNHMEPDHCALIGDLLLRHPETTIVTNAKAATMIQQFFDVNLDGHLKVVKEGDSLVTGRHSLAFYMAPMVHWPEAMVTYDKTDHILFSADAFGSFGAINGNLYADEVDFEQKWTDEARRYFTNIVGKYGVQVQALLKKAATLDIDMICPLHGPVWRENIDWFVEKYDRWSRYEPEIRSIMIVYGSIYGNTEAAATLLSAILADNGTKHIALYDASHTNVSQLLSEAFKYSHIVLAASTYNNGIFTPIENLVNEFQSHNLQHRKFAIIENGTWSPQSGKHIREKLGLLKGCTIIVDNLTLKSTLHNEQMADIDQLANLLLSDIADQ